jgi:uncharacterized membrane protein
MTRTRKLLVAAAVVLLAIQLVPVSRTNPPVESEPRMSAEVRALLKRACFDCHSHETAWPLQARVAPASWLVAHDVKEGREELNFSRWASLDGERLAKASREIVKEVATEKEMPPALYVLAHPEARLTDAERAVIARWAEQLAAPPAPAARP